MNEPSETTSDDNAPMLTQAQLYDDLRRIGQLEDQKHAIQAEIDSKTERLRSALPQLEQDSLLYQMLAAAMQPKGAAKKKKKTSRRNTKKTAKKKR